MWGLAHRLTLCLTRYLCSSFFFFFNDTATPEIYPLPLHDALPILAAASSGVTRSTTREHCSHQALGGGARLGIVKMRCVWIVTSVLFLRTRRSVIALAGTQRSEEHTSELQSLAYLVCRLLLEKKKT